MYMGLIVFIIEVMNRYIMNKKAYQEVKKNGMIACTMLTDKPANAGDSV